LWATLKEVRAGLALRTILWRALLRCRH
jgi:hypothetical protein